MVNLTRIYTRTGDAGTTRLGDMSETAKTDLRLEAYACVDEGNAHIGVALAHGDLADDVVTLLTRVQNDLFDVGADFSTPVVPDPTYPPLRVEQDYVDRLEAWCDHYNEELPGPALLHPQRRHPRGGAPARRTHGRTTCRTGGLGGVGRARGHDEHPRPHLSQPALGPALHPRPSREP